MNKLCLISISVFSLILSGCKPKNTDWSALYEAGKEEQMLYQTTLSEDNYENALKIYKQVIDGSPELRNSALMQSSMMLREAHQYEKSIKAAKQISDTAKALQRYCNKSSVLVNVIRAEQALFKNDFDEWRGYSKKTIKEMQAFLYERRDSIYRALIISSGYEVQDHVVTFSDFELHDTEVRVYGADLQALAYYFIILGLYDREGAKKELLHWKEGMSESNENTEAYFSHISSIMSNITLEQMNQE